MSYYDENGEATNAPRPELLADYMMALINACHTISDECLPELIGKVRELEPQELQNYQFFTRPAVTARKELVGIVCNAVTLLANLITDDMGDHFKNLLTPKWLRSRTTQQTILATIDDYGDQVSPRHIRAHVSRFSDVSAH